MKIPLLNEAELRQRIWVELQRATQDRHHEWRTPVLATLGSDGTPQARSVVLPVTPTAPAAPGSADAQAATHHLAVLTAQVQQMDWLELSRGGHRRAVFDASTWEWRVP